MALDHYLAFGASHINCQVLFVGCIEGEVVTDCAYV